VSQATETYSREFDSIFFQLPPHIRDRIEGRIHACYEMPEFQG